MCVSDKVPKACKARYEARTQSTPPAPLRRTPLADIAAEFPRGGRIAGGDEGADVDLRGEGGALLRALRHFCAYHDVALRPSVREHLRAQLSTSGGRQATLELSQLLRLPHTSPPPYVDLTPRRLPNLDGMGDTGRLPTHLQLRTSLNTSLGFLLTRGKVARLTSKMHWATASPTLP